MRGRETMMTDTPSRNRNPFDTDTGYSGQDYHRDREAELLRQEPPGQVDPRGPDRAPDAAPDDAAIGRENGRFASFDPATGQLHGSGAKEGEEFDAGSTAGSGYKKTGAETDPGAPDSRP
jgi:hypothetical protein